LIVLADEVYESLVYAFHSFLFFRCCCCWRNSCCCDNWCCCFAQIGTTRPNTWKSPLCQGCLNEHWQREVQEKPSP
jgi:hypothetical protein